MVYICGASDVAGEVVKGLTKLLADNAPKAMKEQKLESYFGCKIAINTSMSIYRFLIVVGRMGTEMLTNEAGEVTSHLQGMFHYLVHIVAYLQKLLTCQTYTDKEGIRQQQLLAFIPRHHKHYILPNFFSKKVHFSPQLQTDPRKNYLHAKSRLQPSGFTFKEQETSQKLIGIKQSKFRIK
ncbi:flap endonuclease 1 isoform X2 [Gossypium raimondii]|nr:flap endonuclease 1 isoform X2 [Gossypium raimondii]